MALWLCGSFRKRSLMGCSCSPRNSRSARLGLQPFGNSESISDCRLNLQLLDLAASSITLWEYFQVGEYFPISKSETCNLKFPLSSAHWRALVANNHSA